MTNTNHVGDQLRLDLLREAAAIPIKPHTLSFPLADANRALQELKAGRYSGAGVLVLP